METEGERGADRERERERDRPRASEREREREIGDCREIDITGSHLVRQVDKQSAKQVDMLWSYNYIYIHIYIYIYI